MEKILSIEGDSQGKEYIFSKFRQLDLLRLTLGQEQELERLIALQGRYLDVLVHPYYMDSPDYPTTSEYIHGRDEFIKSSITTEKPLLILQDTYGEIEANTRDIQGGTLYVVNGAFSNHLEFLAANPVADILKRTGVTHITVGGRILMYADDPEALIELAQLQELGDGKSHAMEWLSRNMLPYGCPMWVATGFLKRGFDISFSPISSPAVLNHPEKLE